MIQFFMPMKPPTVTHQEKQVRVVKGRDGKSRPVFYEPAELKRARVLLRDNLARHTPEKPMHGPVRLVVKWCFPKGRHPAGAYKDTKPDTDNLQKLLKDVMTELGYWNDDAQVCSEITEKFWAELPGILVHVEELEGQK